MAGTRKQQKKKGKTMIYQWRTFDYPVSAQKAGEHIEELDKKHGEITPKILVDDARPEDALMHPLYEWNDSVAAEKYRYGQARKIMSELVTVRIANDAPEIKDPIRAFVSVRSQNESASFRPIVAAMSDEETKKQVIENARSELDAFERKYRGLVDIIPILEDMLSRLLNS